MPGIKVRNKATGEILTAEDFAKKQRSIPENSQFVNGSDEDVANTFAQHYPDQMEIVLDQLNTTPPPIQALKNAADKYLQPVADVAKTAAGPIGDFLQGATTAVTGIPAMAARITGNDPSQIKTPIYKTTTDPITRQTTKIPLSLQDLASPPDSLAGKVGGFAGDVASFMVPEALALKGLKAVGVADAAKGVLGAEKAYTAAKTVGHAALSGGLMAGQEYAKTGDPQAAANAMILGSGVPLAIGAGSGAADLALQAMTGKGLRETAKAAGEWMVSRAFSPLMKDLKPAERKIMVDRAADTFTKLNQEGIESSSKRWSNITTALSDASHAAEQQGITIDSATIQGGVGRYLNDLLRDGQSTAARGRNAYIDVMKGLEQRLSPLGLPSVDVNGNFTGPLTPMQAEAVKKDMNAALGDYYRKIKSGTQSDLDSDIKSRVQASIADSIRKEQAAKIGNVTVDGKIMPYKQAANLARLDATIMDYADTMTSAKYPGGSGGSSFIPTIALGELVSGHMLRPSQIGYSVFNVLPGLEESVGGRLIRGPVTKAYKSTGMLGPTLETSKPPVTTQDKNGKDVKINILDRY